MGIAISLVLTMLSILLTVAGSAVTILGIVVFYSAPIGATAFWGWILTQKKELHFLSEIIPGHPVFSVLSVIAVLEVITILLLRWACTRRAAVTYGAATFWFIAVSIVGALSTLDSWQFCTFLTVCALIFFAMLIIRNRRSYAAERDVIRNPLETIPAAGLSTFSFFISAESVVQMIWTPYLKTVPFFMQEPYAKYLETDPNFMLVVYASAVYAVVYIVIDLVHWFRYR